MVAGVNTSATVLSSSSPFILPGSDETKAESKSSLSLLTPAPDTEAASNIANVFTPPASISQLTPSTANVLLAVQEESIPSNFQPPPAAEPKPKPDTSSFGNFRHTLDFLDEIYSDNLNSVKLYEPDKKDDTEDPDNTDKNNNFSADDDAGRQSLPSVTPEKSEFTAAIESYTAIVQKQAAPRADYAASAVDISA